VHAVARSEGMTIDELESTYSLAQIELRWNWLQRDQARAFRAAEWSTTRGVYRAHTGKDPDEP
jgi:hypothetical protein